MTGVLHTRKCDLCEHVLDETWQGGQEANTLLRARGAAIVATRRYSDSSTRRVLHVCMVCELQMLETIVRELQGVVLTLAVEHGRTT